MNLIHHPVAKFLLFLLLLYAHENEIHFGTTNFLYAVNRTVTIELLLPAFFSLPPDLNNGTISNFIYALNKCENDKRVENRKKYAPNAKRRAAATAAIACINFNYEKYYFGFHLSLPFVALISSRIFITQTHSLSVSIDIDTPNRIHLSNPKIIFMVIAIVININFRFFGFIFPSLIFAVWEKFSASCNAYANKNDRKYIASHPGSTIRKFPIKLNLVGFDGARDWHKSQLAAYTFAWEWEREKNYQLKWPCRRKTGFISPTVERIKTEVIW